MSTGLRTRDLQPGTVVRVAYHTQKQTYSLEGVVKDDPSERPGAMVCFEDDPYAPVTTARVYTTHETWLEARERDGRDAPLPNGYVRERLHAAGTTERERQAA
jgi:hypothetical protein